MIPLGQFFRIDKKNIRLMKDVGAPSILVKTLGIEEEQGQIILWSGTLGNLWRR